MKINIPKNIPPAERRRISKIIEKAVVNIGLEKDVFTIDLKISKSLKDNADVNYKNLKEGRISLLIGNRLVKKVDKNLIYHEIFHVWDRLYSRIKFGKKIKKEPKLVRDLIGEIINMSIDGRLEKKGLPHIAKNQRLKLEKIFLRKHYNKKFDEKEIKKLMNKIWGKKFSSADEVILWAKKYYKTLK
jgi:hypothetical protein